MKTQLQNHDQPKCSKCQGSYFDMNEQGATFCANCGLVLQQFHFDNNVAFGAQREMLGKNINAQEKQNQFSSERRLRRARQKIEDLRRKLEIDSGYDQSIQAANRLLKYADNRGFFKKGKNIELYAAAALYITLRFKKAPYLLIDLSDKMNVGLFKLARCYFKLSKQFGFQEELPLIDPSLFIHRYCRMLNLADKTKAVTMTAIRLIKRMKRDWMCQGRRPSSLCGAAILIATKIHKVDSPSCSTTQICKTVFVCDETIRRRLDEFKQTKASKLTPEQFEKEQEIESVDEMDPPAFRKARLRSEQENEIFREVSISKPKKGVEWDENVPQEIIKRYSDEIAKNYERASDRAPEMEIFQDQNEFDDAMEEMSSNTIRDDDSEQEESDNSDIDEKQVLLDEKQQKERKQIWETQNRSWLDKQAAKIQRGEPQGKKKNKKKKEAEKATNPIDAVKNTSLGDKVNEDELKKLFAGNPKIEEQQPKKSLNQIFDPFRFINY